MEKEVITGSTTTTRYVYDNEDILLELNGANSIVARYTHGPGIDEPLIMEKNAQSFYYHADGLGSITEITNQNGTLVQRYAYSSFGKIESQLDPNFVQPYTFTGRELDAESGLYFYRARSFDPFAGRFLQQDPIETFGGTNSYAYVGNSTTNFIDPFGLDIVDGAANFAAGFGDAVSFGITSYVREIMEINYVVDSCSFGYSAGWWTGFSHGLLSGGTSLFNGGAKTVLYSGKGAYEVAKSATPSGRVLLEDTLGGKILNTLNNQLSKNGLELPQTVWDAASAVFAANAKGAVAVSLRDPSAIGTFARIEQPVLTFMNRANSVFGFKGTTAIHF